MIVKILSVAVLAVVAFGAPPLGTNKCTYGPSYWCANEANANECGMLATCQAQGLLKDASTTAAPTVVLGTNKCTYGPAYWCANEANANECGALAVCQAQGLLKTVSRRSAPVGTNKCTYGPSYWCASVDNANECGMLALCQAQGQLLDAPSTAAPTQAPVGTNKCTYGPSYWCANEANANECGALAVCQAQGLLKTVSRRSAPVGTNKCTYGPSYWCASVDNANECDMLALCQAQGQLKDAPTTAAPTQAAVGTNKCTYGPAYWCANEANANECGALSVCQAQGLLTGVARRSAPVGTNKCTYGPSYWCSSAANANECGMLALCQAQGLLTDVPAPTTTAAPQQQQPVGTNKCTYGPAYWCANEANANECGALAVCQDQGLLPSSATAAGARRRRNTSNSGNLIGSSKCTWGPSFWCASAENANLCGALAHCQSQGLLLDAPQPNDIECSLCTFVLKEIEAEIGTNSTEAEITQVVEEVCDILPSSLEAECKSLIEEYGPQIIQLLLQDYTPDQICKDIGLCTAAKQRRSVVGINNLGTNKCTYGPSYWCASVDNANECGALSHCQSMGLLKN